jgi:type III secretion system FlhB-like substrate exporter
VTVEKVLDELWIGVKGQVIPRELYTAVAEVLSYVFKLKKRVMQ